MNELIAKFPVVQREVLQLALISEFLEYTLKKQFFHKTILENFIEPYIIGSFHFFVGPDFNQA